jgi:hypothetical protein
MDKEKEFIINDTFKILEVTKDRWLFCQYNGNYWGSPAVIDILKYSNIFEFRFAFAFDAGGWYVADSKELNKYIINNFFVSLPQDFMEYLDSIMIAIKLSNN